MGILKQQAFYNSAIYYIGVFLGYLNVVILFPSFFGQDEFGLTRLLLSFSTILSMFSHLGFTNVTVRYFPYFKSPKERQKRFLFLVFLIPLIGFLFVIGAFLIVKPWVLNAYTDSSPLFVKHFDWLVPLTFLLLYFEILFYYSKALFRSIAPLAFKEIGIRLLVLAAILLSYFEAIDFEVFLGMFTAAYAFPVVGMVAYLGWIGELFFKPDFKFLSFTYLIGMVKYGLFTLGYQASAVLNKRVDVLMIGSFISSKAVAVYTIAYYISNVIVMPQRGMQHIASPIVADAFANDDLRKIEDVYQRSSLNQMLVGTVIFLIIWLNIQDIFYVIGKDYHKGIMVVFFIGLGQLLNMTIGLTNQIILHSSYYKYNIIFVGLLLVTTVMFNWWFIPIWGIKGAALGTAMSLFFNNLLKATFLWYKYGFQPFSKNHLILLLIIGVVAGIGAVLPDFFDGSKLQIIGNIVLKSSLIAGIYGLLVLLFRPSEDVWETLLKLKKRYIDKQK